MGVFLRVSHVFTISFNPCHHHTYTDSTMNATFEHFEMNTNNAYATLNTAEIATTRLNRAYMTTEETVYATLDGQVLPGMDGYDYVN